MFKKVMLSLLLAVFCLLPILAFAGQYPDTSNCEGSALNVADLGDELKYKTVTTMSAGRAEMYISYHISIGDIEPKYVSLLWSGAEVVGFIYYESGTFKLWMKPSPMDLVFKKYVLKRITLNAFSNDFKGVWPDVKFPILPNAIQ